MGGQSAITALWFSAGLVACASEEAGDPQGGNADGATATSNEPGMDAATSTTPGTDAAPGTDVVPMLTRDFTEVNADFLNPERGYYVGYDLRGAGNAGGVRSAGRTLAITLVRLDAYRAAPLDAALLASLSAGFAAARQAGIKVILRFTYNASFAADAPRARILGHIAQLAPLLQANADVIAVMQAGFIGAWGEWHTSTNGLDNDADRAAILTAILAALPTTRGVQVRTPMFKAAAFPGGPLTESEAYATSARARVGHHNDCFLASASDLGTYASPVATWEAYVAGDGRYTAIGGETCQVYAPRTACAAAIAEMETQHWSYLNHEYNQAVLAAWVTAGCGDEIQRRLGYRFAFDRVTHSAAVAPGGELALTLELHNAGFAAPFNRRPVEIVLDDGTTRRVARLATVDARRWQGGSSVTLALRLRLPADVTPGRYTLAVRLPDADARLAADPRYAIRVANDGVWREATGDNVLSDTLLVDTAAPGARDLTATAFRQLR